MSEKICPNGHTYVGNRCARDNWVEPVATDTAPESEVTGSADSKESKPVTKKKTAPKTAKKVVAKKVSPKKVVKAKSKKSKK